jgi:Tfp pilus assembly protein PilX
MDRQKQKGMALILVIVLLVVVSIMGTSLMFLSQTETWSSANYRLMTQSRYGAEAGANSAINYLLNSYTPPVTGGSDPLSNYVLNATGVNFEGDSVGVTYGGNAVVLHSSSSSSNYPVSATETSFKNAATGTLTAGNITVNYSAHATLLSMRQITPYGSTTPVTIQTWRVTGDANISGAQNAQVEVSTLVERQVTPVFTYAAFADDNGCSAMTFGGGGITGSYDDTAVVGGTVATQASGGNVGTNGNLVTSGNPTTINGSLSTPRSGVGVCTAFNITAWTDNAGHVTGGITELPQPITYPTPVIPAPGSQDLSLSHGANCPSGVNAIPGCTASGNDFHLPPGSYGNITVTGQETLHLTTGIYNINSFREQSAQSSLVIDSGPVIFNVTGNGGGTVVDLTGNSVQNASLNPMNFQVMYAGTGTINLKGQSQASGLLYAPNATFSFAGGGSWYGAVIGAAMGDMGGAAIYYDRRLNNSGFTVGNYMQDSFTWKKY